MKNSSSQIAVMNLEEGEEIFAEFDLRTLEGKKVSDTIH